MRKSKKKILLLKKIISSCLFLIATACCYGQTVTLKGVVKDEGGQTL